MNYLSIVLVSMFAASMALPAKMPYQPSFFYQAQATPQHVMYLQYVQQPSSSRTSSRLTNAAAAFVAGNTVATGTYLKDDVSEIAEQSILENTQVALEDESEVASADEIAETEVDESPIVEDESAPVEDDQSSADVPDENESEPAESDDEVPEDSENDETEEEYLEDDDSVPESPKASSVANGGFFPINFGSVSGGSVAVANSFSTGENGLAKSQAIAYGKTETRKVRRH